MTTEYSKTINLNKLPSELSDIRDNVYKLYKTHLTGLRNLELLGDEKLMNNYLNSTTINESFIVKDLPNKKAVKILQRNHHSFLSMGLDRINKVTNKLINHVTVAATISPAVAFVASGHTAFAVLSVIPITSLIAINLLSKKINEKVISHNIEKMATRMAELEVEKVKGKIKESVMDNLDVESPKILNEIKL